MVQMENEYGSYGNVAGNPSDKKYMRHLISIAGGEQPPSPSPALNAQHAPSIPSPAEPSARPTDQPSTDPVCASLKQ